MGIGDVFEGFWVVVGVEDLIVGVVEGKGLLVFLSGLHFAAIAFFAEGEVEVVAVVAYPVALPLEGGNSIFVDDIFDGGVVCVHLNSNDFKFIT